MSSESSSQALFLIPHATWYLSQSLFYSAVNYSFDSLVESNYETAKNILQKTRKWRDQMT